MHGEENLVSQFEETIKIENIDLSPLGLDMCQVADAVTYYCTPKDAQIIGWAGVDGIHYCKIPEFGEMIFAVNPMDFGECVHPIARSFCDLLRLLVSGVDMAALDQCYAWDEAQFQAFLQENPATTEQQAVLNTIRERFDLEPLAAPFEYVKELQDGFDLSKIAYDEEFI